MAGLVCVLAWESLPGAADPVAATQISARTSPATPHEAPRPVATWTSQILARPLFAQNRRPMLVAAHLPVRASVAAESLPRLAGTIRSNNALMAIFQSADTGFARPFPAPNMPRDAEPPAPSAKPVVVGRDGMVEGWRVQDITDETATLERDGRSVTLHISYANLPQGAAQVTPPQLAVLLHEKRTNAFLQP
jgi:hypothetical protein